jgi:hypothetical protein
MVLVGAHQKWKAFTFGEVKKKLIGSMELFIKIIG